jgi:hypothetical protein
LCVGFRRYAAQELCDRVILLELGSLLFRQRAVECVVLILGAETQRMPPEDVGYVVRSMVVAVAAPWSCRRNFACHGGGLIDGYPYDSLYITKGLRFKKGAEKPPMPLPINGCKVTSESLRNIINHRHSGLLHSYLSLIPSGHLLHRPAITIRVAEEDERSPVELLDLADLDSTFDELLTRSVYVRDH